MQKFTEHPHSVNETYLQHMGVAFSFGGKMLSTSLTCFIHGIFPFMFTHRGRESIEELHRRVCTHRHLECCNEEDLSLAE